MMMTLLMWAVAAVVLPACGWLAAARVYQRRVDALLLQGRTERQQAAERFNQARHQIGQLQAELAQRPAPLRRPVSDDSLSTDRAAVVDRFQVLEDGFPKTMIGPQGFMPTQLIG